MAQWNTFCYCLRKFHGLNFPIKSGFKADKLVKSLLRAILATFGKRFMKCWAFIRLKRIKIAKLFEEHMHVFFCNALYIHSPDKIGIAPYTRLPDGGQVCTFLKRPWTGLCFGHLTKKDIHMLLLRTLGRVFGDERSILWIPKWASWASKRTFCENIKVKKRYVAEGFVFETNAEFIRCLQYAKRSCTEMPSPWKEFNPQLKKTRVFIDHFFNGFSSLCGLWPYGSWNLPIRKY